MLGLTLRDEFMGRRLKGTAIELTNKNNTGATQISATEFLRITYPSHDVMKTIEAAGPSQGRPITLKGERGQGKSHLMAVLYHAFTDHAATKQWLDTWSHSLGDSKISAISLRNGMHVIGESLHRQRYKYLWDLLFDNHPHGGYCRGSWENLGEKRTDIPSDEILLELFQHTPTVLILDEFQTWYDGLTDTNKSPQRTWAFNFIQILSEIAKEHPEYLVLVVSVRDSNTDAFQQIQRVNPVVVDFKGPSAKNDRLRLLLHRLFENRTQVDTSTIEELIGSHISEYFRLMSIAPAERAKIHDEFLEAWPYAPHLMQLLEDQVLIATSAQGTRDLIRILVDLYKSNGEDKPILTAADFRPDDEASGITALLDSVANQHHAKLREKALRNLQAVNDAIAGTAQKLPHLEEIIGALWLRSLAEVNQAGADLATLQVDVTRDKPVDDNGFQVEIATIVENSFNIHEDGNCYIFKEEENPQAKLIANARNDKLFQQNEDRAHLAKETRYVLEGSSGVDLPYRVIVLPQEWKINP
jgi:predicted AAA+ superfamily ATPase